MPSMKLKYSSIGIKDIAVSMLVAFPPSNVVGGGEGVREEGRRRWLRLLLLYPPAMRAKGSGWNSCGGTGQQGGFRKDGQRDTVITSARNAYHWSDCGIMRVPCV